MRGGEAECDLLAAGVAEWWSFTVIISTSFFVSASQQDTSWMWRAFCSSLNTVHLSAPQMQQDVIVTSVKTLKALYVLARTHLNRAEKIVVLIFQQTYVWYCGFMCAVTIQTLWLLSSAAESLCSHNEAELQRHLAERQEEISHVQEILETKVLLLQEVHAQINCPDNRKIWWNQICHTLFVPVQC